MHDDEKDHLDEDDSEINWGESLELAGGWGVR